MEFVDSLGVEDIQMEKSLYWSLLWLKSEQIGLLLLQPNGEVSQLEEIYPIRKLFTWRREDR